MPKSQISGPFLTIQNISFCKKKISHFRYIKNHWKNTGTFTFVKFFQFSTLPNIQWTTSYDFWQWNTNSTEYLSSNFDDSSRHHKSPPSCLVVMLTDRIIDFPYFIQSNSECTVSMLEHLLEMNYIKEHLNFVTQVVVSDPSVLFLKSHGIKVLMTLCKKHKNLIFFRTFWKFPRFSNSVPDLHIKRSAPQKLR